MNDFPGHILPTYSIASLEDAIFHYTTADGLIGIFERGEIWNTAYYCANDESELAAGKGILEPLFRSATHRLIEDNDPRVLIFSRRGVDIRDYVSQFERQIASMTLGALCAYITCFCRSKDEEDFQHGLLSQWRGYGADGGYALHFSRKKLLAAMAKANEKDETNYELQDVHYSVENPLKSEVLGFKDAFVSAYLNFLDELSKPISLDRKSMKNPLSDLTGGPLETFLDYLVHTKNKHFSEERECRLSLIQSVTNVEGNLPVQYFNRGGLLVPYTNTLSSRVNVLDCIEWIVIGPGSRMKARIKSVSQLVRQSGRDIKVRPSHIPFTRL